MTDENEPNGGTGTVSLELQQSGQAPASATAKVTPAPALAAPSLGAQILAKFLDPSSLASLASTAVGLWMIVNQPDREPTAWFLIGAGGLLVPAVGIAKKVAGMGSSK